MYKTLRPPIVYYIKLSTPILRYFDCLCPGCGDAELELSKHSARCEREACPGGVSVSVILLSTSKIQIFKNASLQISDWSWSPCDKCGSELSREARFRWVSVWGDDMWWSCVSGTRRPIRWSGRSWMTTAGSISVSIEKSRTFPDTICKFLDTDVNEFLVRQMSPLFHHQDIELLQVSF